MDEYLKPPFAKPPFRLSRIFESTLARTFVSTLVGVFVRQISLSPALCFFGMGALEPYTKASRRHLGSLLSKADLPYLGNGKRGGGTYHATWMGGETYPLTRNSNCYEKNSPRFFLVFF